MLSLLALGAAAWSPVPGIHMPHFADSCTGSGDPPAATPACYEGKASFLGVRPKSEGVEAGGGAT